jgi:hypothetical protein
MTQSAIKASDPTRHLHVLITISYQKRGPILMNAGFSFTIRHISAPPRQHTPEMKERVIENVGPSSLSY